ncbi:MAG: NAD-dependent deacylase [Alphaproteobacteria bacterium]
MVRYKNIVILTGAGISAESGIQTFRDADGLWTKVDIEDVATPEGFARNPKLVHDFYNARRLSVREAPHNAAHEALGRLQREHPGEVTLVTQNVDGLHEKGGAPNVLHMHGELGKIRCNHCEAITQSWDELSLNLACTACSQSGGMRPHVVWFGEMPLYMDHIMMKLAAADLFISIGTSGAVYPAAGFVSEARARGAHTVELNLEPSDGAHYFAESHYGPATEVVPAYIEDLLNGA